MCIYTYTYTYIHTYISLSLYIYIYIYIHTNVLTTIPPTRFVHFVHLLIINKLYYTRIYLDSRKSGLRPAILL